LARAPRDGPAVEFGHLVRRPSVDPRGHGRRCPVGEFGEHQGPGGTHRGVGGVGGEGQLGQVRGDPTLDLVAARQEGSGPLAQRCSPPGELGELCAERLFGSRLQGRRVAIPPPAVAPPEVVHDELRFVVEALEVGPLGQVRWYGDGVDRLVESRARVEERHGLLDQGLEQLGRFAEREADPITAEDRQPVAWKEHLGVEAGHLPQRRRPLGGVALDLLWVPRVRGDPDEQVTGAQHPLRRVVDPGGVIGLAQRVVQLQPSTGEVELKRGGVGEVGVAVVARPPQLLQAELPSVDDLVVPRGRPVAVEASGDPHMAHDPWGFEPPSRRIGLEGSDPGDVVEVAVGVHHRVDAGIAVATELGPDMGRDLGTAGVDEDEPLVGLQRGDIGPGGEEPDPRGHLDEVASDGEGGGHWPIGRGPLTGEELLSEGQEISAHGG